MAKGRPTIRVKSKKSPPVLDPALALARATRPLLSLFAVVDDVFTEPNALSPEARQKSLGRVYEEWKRCRRQLDPGFDEHRYVQHELPSKRARPDAVMRRDELPVLRTQRRPQNGAGKSRARGQG